MFEDILNSVDVFGNSLQDDDALPADDSSPEQAIARVAQERGVDPAYLMGLAKLETRMGDASIKGDGVDTRNLFNIKDFSGRSGVAALDKAEGSRDRYRQYDSYDESARDLVSLLDRKYQGALDAQSPQEFAQKLKQGGYATDPNYVSKLSRTIGSTGARAPTGQAQANQSPKSDSFLGQYSDDELLASMGYGGPKIYQRDEAEPVAPTGFLRSLGDTALSFQQGATGAMKSLTDVAGADNSVSQTIDEANKFAATYYSPARQAEMAKRQALIEQADKNGHWTDQVAARLGGIAEAPIDSLAQAAGSIVPIVAANLATGGAASLPGVVGAGARYLLPGAIGSAMGVGSVKGQNYEAVYNQAKKEGMDEVDAKALALKASEYSQENAAQQALGGALGTLDSLTGAPRMLKELIQKGAKEAGTVAGKGFLRRVGEGGLEEAIPEGFQGAQGKYAENEAMNNAGFKVDPWAGVVGSGVNDAVLGAMLGGPLGGMHSGQTQPGQTPAQIAAAEKAARLVAEQAAAEAQRQATLRKINEAAAQDGTLSQAAVAVHGSPDPVVPSEAPVAPPVAEPLQPDATVDPAGITPPVAPPVDNSFANILDTDNVYQSWSNVRDGTDRETMRSQMDYVTRTYGPLINDTNRADVQKELNTGFKWFRSATPQQQDAALNALAAQKNQQTPIAPPAEPAPPIELTRAREVEELAANAIVMQNRDRSSQSSIAQMNDIASAPDYLRTGPSNVMESGAPVVFGGLGESALFGKTQVITDGKGQRTPVQYAVVEADNVLASHQADGTIIPEYETGAPGMARAVAGNGRTAGIKEAYRRGTASQYAKDLIDDAPNLGIDPNQIAGMKSPVLVRVMESKYVTPDIADRSNISGTARLSPVEQAGTDARRLDLTSLIFDDLGDPTQDSIMNFVNSMPRSEQTELIGANGEPTRQAVNRLMAATFKQAYGSDDLVDLYAQAQDPESKNVLSALADAAGVMTSLKNTGEHDIRGAVAEAAEFAVNARRQGMKLSEALMNNDMLMSDEAFVVAHFMANNIRKPKKISEGLRTIAAFAAEQSQIERENLTQNAMFGATPTASRGQIFEKLGNIEELVQKNKENQASYRTNTAQAATENTVSDAPTTATTDTQPDVLPTDVASATPGKGFSTKGSALVASHKHKGTTPVQTSIGWVLRRDDIIDVESRVINDPLQISSDRTNQQRLGYSPAEPVAAATVAPQNKPVAPDIDFEIESLSAQVARMNRLGLPFDAERFASDGLKSSGRLPEIYTSNQAVAPVDSALAATDGVADYIAKNEPSMSDADLLDIAKQSNQVAAKAASDAILVRAKKKLTDRIESGKQPLLTISSNGGVRANSSNDDRFGIDITLLPDEKKALRVAQADRELADTEEEIAAARDAEQAAVAPANRRTETKPC